VEGLEIDQGQLELVLRLDPVPTIVVVRVRPEKAIAGDDPTEIPLAIFGGLFRALRRTASPQEMVIRSEVRASKAPVFASCHVLPTALREKAVISTCDEPRSVFELYAIGGF
jgi:hypothetical protein